ncbi:MAG TPA: HAD family hydrolase [Eubacteriaceae bacterium]|nr:HAD family hydrolase [Eubacteriaceae bacterium]
MLSDVKTIIFDFDGTLHESISIYAPAFRKAYKFLTDRGYVKDRQWDDDEISIWLGYSPADMWEKFLPNLNRSVREQASLMIRDEMSCLLHNNKGRLYEGSLEVLNRLKSKGYVLVFLSNCRESYKDAVRNVYGLDRYFEEFITTEAYGFKPKHHIVKEIKGRLDHKIIIVGDRVQDIEAGFLNDIETIACRYGYGKEEEFILADYIIDDIRELLKGVDI